jgi:hypothetical protein
MHQGNNNPLNSYVLSYNKYNVYFNNIYGDIYSALPQKLYVIFLPISFDKPKSANFTCPSASIIIFYGFKSR